MVRLRPWLRPSADGHWKTTGSCLGGSMDSTALVKLPGGSFGFQLMRHLSQNHQPIWPSGTVDVYHFMLLSVGYDLLHSNRHYRSRGTGGLSPLLCGSIGGVPSLFSRDARALPVVIPASLFLSSLVYVVRSLQTQQGTRTAPFHLVQLSNLKSESVGAKSN